MTVLEDRLGAWIPQVQGQYINMDWNPTNKGFGAQCWDLAAHWSNFLGLPIIHTGNTATKKGRWPGWAGNRVDCFPQTPAIAAAYTLHGPGETGQPGDIVVWGDSNKVWYPATHVAVLVSDKGAWLTVISLNSTPSRADNPYPEWTSGPTTLQNLPRQGLIGFIRPKVGGLQLHGTTTPASEEDEVTKEQMDALLAAIKVASDEATNAKNNASDAKQVATDARNEATNAKNNSADAGKLASAALQAITGLLHTRLPDPNDPERQYSLADWIVYGNLKAGGAHQVVSELTPEVIAAAVAKASAGVDAQAIADRLTVTVKEG